MSFYDEVIRKSKSFGSTVRCTDLELLEPVTRAAVQAIVQEAAVLGQPLLVFETYRSQERQQQLFKQRATQLHTVGVHHYGLACDLVKDINGEPSWKGPFDFVGMLAVKYGLIWGGTWKGFVDASHVQRITVTDQPRLFAGVWYPDNDYNPYLRNPNTPVY